MAFEIEALPARYGDAIILHWGEGKAALIDGGPAKVWKDSVRTALERLGEEQGGTPRLELLVLSHIDDDHIHGLLDLASAMRTGVENGEPPIVKIQRAWNNSFDDIIGNDGKELVGPGGKLASLASAETDGGAVIASVAQGRKLRDELRGLGLEGNKPFGTLIVATGDGKSVKKIAGLKITIIAPSATRVKALQKDWSKKVKALKEKEAKPSELAALLDKSIPNLSSIAFLAEAEGRRMLLTGDARGDDIIEGLENADLLDDDGRIEVDVFKLPHHGSHHNVNEELFDRVRAAHYIASGDGTYGNPEADTFKYLAAAREDDDFTIHITYPLAKFTEPAAATRLKKFFAKQKKDGRSYEVRYRGANAKSIRL